VTDLTAAEPIGAPVPPPVVDPDIDGVFHQPPSRDAKRQAVAISTVLAALLLHLILFALLLAEWRTAALPPVRPLQVRLVPEVPKPPPPQPKPRPPQPKAEPEKPKPKPVAEATKPVEPKPRESGPDEKTEAAKHDKPNPAPPPPLPVQPKAEEIPPPPTPLPQPPEPKPTPPRVKPKEAAIGRSVPMPLDELPPALRPQRPAAPAVRNLVLRLPSPGSGSAERDFAGDAYLNRLTQLLQRNRIYPPADLFAGALSRFAVYGVVIEPSGAVVNVTLIQPTGVSVLDEDAREMITNSSPFPHLPADYPQLRTYLTVVIPIYPR
jgi:protein TonB